MSDPSLVSELRGRLWPSDQRYRFRLARDGAVDVKHPLSPSIIVMIRRTPHGFVRVVTGPGFRPDERLMEYLPWHLDALADDVASILGGNGRPPVSPSSPHPDGGES